MKKNSSLQMVGNIDFDKYVNQYAESYPCFKILRIYASFYGQRSKQIQFGPTDKDVSSYYSLFIGKNGVGKSSLFREILDFFVLAQKGAKSTEKETIRIRQVDYVLNGNIYKILRNGNVFEYTKNHRKVEKDYVEFPLIIACSMGMFDKFPVNSINKPDRKSRYDIDSYRYVGPKANSNMFTSKTNILVNTLSLIGTHMSWEQKKKIKSVLNHIGYKGIISYEFYINSNKSYYTVNQQSSTEWMDSRTSDYFSANQDRKPVKYDLNLEVLNQDLESPVSFYEINQLKQHGFTKSFKCYFYTNNNEQVNCDNMSSGEFNLLILTLNILLAPYNKSLLILLDEPEISQHPNWQLDFLDILDKGLKEYKSHIFIATHSHFLVSNLPLGRSRVVNMERDDNGIIDIKYLQSETYGWSAEEVLLKVFKMGTDRSIFLAKTVGDFLVSIGNDSIPVEEVKAKLVFLDQVSTYLSDVDPMKKVITSIIKEFNS